MTNFRLGIDVGGTFTDIVLLGDDGTILTAKVSSTPDDYSHAILQGVQGVIEMAGIDAGSVREVGHGTTVATNTIIERKGPKIALITTKGFRDVLEIGRYRLPRLYDLTWRKPDPLIERQYRFEVPERLNHKGEILTPLDMESVEDVCKSIVEQGIESVAICLLHSYASPDHELAIAEHLRVAAPDMYICASADVLPQMQEYERTSTVVINAYIRPVLERYVAALQEKLANMGIKAPLLVMQSNGGVMPAEAASETPIYIIESGPAAGVVGALRLSDKLKQNDIITFDMGGTTAKVSIIEDREPTLAPEYEVGGGMNIGHRLMKGAGYIVRVPTIDIAEVGAGGGSIAWVDKGGALQVGPRSAGASPGPICYDMGGTEPTITDANVVLGYLNREHLLGGGLKIDTHKAEEAIARLGSPLGLSAHDTAYGIHTIVNSNMIRALRSVSTERGRDPRRFMLFGFGGSGPVHAVGMAKSLGMPTVVIPPLAGLFSSLGLLFADVEHHLVRAFFRILDEVNPEELNAHLETMYEQARDILGREGYEEGHQDITVYADVQYVGQNTALTIPVPGKPATRDVLAALGEGFAQEHERTYGYRSDGERLQIVSLKVVGRGIPLSSRIPDRIISGAPAPIPSTDGGGGEKGDRDVYFGPREGWIATPVVSRASLAGGTPAGPLIVEEYDSTTVVLPGCSVRLDEWSNITVEIGA